MTIKRVYIKEILAFLSDRVLGVDGLQEYEKETLFIDNLADVQHVNETTLDWVNPAKAKAELGWEAKYGIEDMVRDSWNWQKNNPNGY